MYKAVVITVLLLYVDKYQSVFDWWDMSLIETCIPVLTCICGNSSLPHWKRDRALLIMCINALKIVCAYHNIILSG